MSDDKVFQELTAELKRRQSADRSLAGWTVSKVTRRSHQRLYQAGGEYGLTPHQNRQVEELSYNVLVYVHHGTPVVMGEGRLDIDPHSPLNPQLDNVLQIARAGGNRPWTLTAPPASPYPNVLTADPNIIEDAGAALDMLGKQVLETVRSLSGVHVNSAELFVNAAVTEFETATGIANIIHRSDIYFEIAMEKLPLPNSQEVNNFTASVSAAGARLPEFIRQCAEETRSLGNTVEPATSETVAALLPADATAKILCAVRERLDAMREYQKLPHFLPGAPVFSGEKKSDADALTLTLDPFLESMVESSSCTGEGQIPRKAVVVENGVVQAQSVTNRWGQYLGKSPNYILGNLCVAPGRFAERDLLKQAKNVVEVVSFSSLLVDDNKMTWSSEIKFAKQHNPDGSVTLIKGGVMAGSIRENLADCLFSRETTTYNHPGSGFSRGVGYSGPSKTLFRRGVTIAGK